MLQKISAVTKHLANEEQEFRLKKKKQTERGVTYHRAVIINNILSLTSLNFTNINFHCTPT